MAMNNTAGTVVAQNGWNGGWRGYGSDAQYCGSNYDRYYVYILQFTTPEFTGVSESATVSIRVSSGVEDTVPLRYALCRSDANKDSYLHTCAEVADANQLAAGTVSFENVTSRNTDQTVYIPCTALKPSTTYYLLLWAYNDMGNRAFCTISGPSDHAVSLGYNTGLIQVTVDGEVKSCAVDIFLDGAWIENVLPEVCAGGQWHTGC